MSDLLIGSIGNRRAPSREALDKAHRLATTASVLLGVYLAALLGSVAWYALNPFYVGRTPDIVIGVAFVVAAIAFAAVCLTRRHKKNAQRDPEHIKAPLTPRGETGAPVAQHV